MELNKNLLIIGRLDKADFLELDLMDIDVKIDTGAFTSAIHCHNIREVNLSRNSLIRFNLLDPTHPQYNERELIHSNYYKKTIKSSTGHIEDRYIIKTNVVLFERIFPIELSLTDRTEMKYPILIGRRLLQNNFLVDVSATHLSYQQKKKNYQLE